MRKSTPMRLKLVKKLVWKTVEEGKGDDVNIKKPEEIQGKSLLMCNKRDVVITVRNIAPMADVLGRPDQSARLISDW